MAGGEGACFEYTLRVAYLQAHFEHVAKQPLPKELEEATSTTQSGSSRRSHDGSFFASFDLGSLMGKDSSKSPKYPEKLLKVFDGFLQRIAMGQEPKFSDQRFRRTVARFWSSTWADKTFQRQMKESRKIEDLILAFVTMSTKTLQKDDELADGSWKSELSLQVSLFLDLLYDCLITLGPLSTELSTRLQSYRNRMKAQTDNEKAINETRKEKKELVKSNTQKSRSQDWWKGSMVDIVANLYSYDKEDFNRKVLSLEKECTEQAALDDLKKCLKLLNTENPYPYTPQDFSDPGQWNAWRSSEVSALSQMMLNMMQTNPNLTQSSDRHSTSEISSQIDSLNLDSTDHRFTFIPPNPRNTYRELLHHCLAWDLEILKTLPEDEDVSLGILSPEHISLLQSCASRWRLPVSFRSSSFLIAIVDHYQKGEVPSACVFEAMAMVDRAEEEMPSTSWPINDRRDLEQAMQHRNIYFLQALEAALESPGGYHSEAFQEVVEDWITLQVPESQEASLSVTINNIIDSIKSQAFNSYINQASKLLDQEGSKTCVFAMQLGTWIEKEAKKLDKKFGSPITTEIDIVPLVLQQHLTLWFRDLEDTMLAQTAEELRNNMEELFVLYRKACKLSDMGKAFSKDASYILRFPLSPLFVRVVNTWLDQTNLKTKEWSDQALAVDTFEPASENGPSSSVTDLFDSFRSAVQFLMELKWPDEQQLAVFATRLAKIISISISDYCAKIEQLFAEDMRQNETVITTAKQKAWLDKAKATIASLQGEKKLQAFFNFTPQSCVKLNNIQSARQQLDQLYEDLRVDDLSAYDVSELSPQATTETFLFTVKIVLAEGLAMEGSTKLPDSFVILSDEHGNRFAKTRTIHDDTDPRWDESFDIPVKGSAWFMATIRHRNMTGKHDLLGRAYLRLDPSQHVDLVPKDVLLPLDTRGHVLMRVGMEGERDDIQYHFGRAFRWLKRTEADLVRIFVDKMTPVLRHTLSRSSIKSVLKPNVNGTIPLDYNEAIGKLSAAYRSAIGSAEYSIPPTKEERHRGPTDAEIETAIHPLFDYLDTNNHTLASSLSHDSMQMVMAKLWKQILVTIEALIVPPLSDKPSKMRALSDGELDIALKWLKFLRDFFYVGGDASGVPLNTLQNPKFNEILSVRIYYDWNTDDLMEECIRGFQSTLKYRATRPSKSLLSQRNLGTIRARKSAKRAIPNTSSNTEMIMRILRMRQGTQEFLAQQLQTISVVKLENPKKDKSINSRLSRGK
ncbi:uncharacterized protein L201_002079 [Kwoniella dendrophila CBS 6074]|uniref:Uncharacterized protein n=1 Tax=Kwoniella dendrophila CBS 6074 TaxID=1295534 RepID=A0AAX4JRT7_9TREE